MDRAKELAEIMVKRVTAGQRPNFKVKSRNIETETLTVFAEMFAEAIVEQEQVAKEQSEMLAKTAMHLDRVEMLLDATNVPDRVPPSWSK